MGDGGDFGGGDCRGGFDCPETGAAVPRRVLEPDSGVVKVSRWLWMGGLDEDKTEVGGNGTGAV